MPEKEQELFSYLLEDLQETGPIQKGWPNFSAPEKINITVIYHIIGLPVGEKR